MRFLPKLSSKEYRVSVGQDEWVAPEETLLDSGSGYSDLEMPISQNVFRFTAITVAVLSVVIMAASFKMSILEHDYFAALSFNNRTVNFSVPPPRGLIVDRQGRPLVKNMPSFDLLVVSRALPKDAALRDQVLSAVAGILERPADEFKEFMALNTRKHAVFFADVDLTKEQVLALKNIELPGLSLITGTRRRYVDGAQFSSVIGYVGRVSKEDLAEDSYYLPSDMIGRLGIESAYETDLRGTHGKITFVKKGEEGVSEEPLIGRTVQLNLDFDLQKKLYSVMFEILRDANLGSAAAVVQDPRNGAVLALVSFPGFDNNIFNDEVTESEFQRLFQSASKPLFNRAISGRYNPGSTIKPFIGMAALEEKVITPGDVINDCVGITIPNPFNPAEPYVFKNWRVEFGAFNLRKAIANSCNVYFFTVGGGFERFVGLGVQKIAHYLNKALANVKLGIDIPGEESGFVPTPEWKKKTRGEPWYQGDTYNISIGQGDLLVTPLWLNAYVSAVANGGTLYKPVIAGSVLDEDKNPLRTIPSSALGELPFSPEVIKEMQFAMRETIISGTAKTLQDLPVQAAAKTGTAEVIKGRSINSLFTAYAPFDQPELAITVLIEGSASNQGYAIQTAHQFLKWYFTR